MLLEYCTHTVFRRKSWRSFCVDAAAFLVVKKSRPMLAPDSAARGLPTLLSGAVRTVDILLGMLPTGSAACWHGWAFDVPIIFADSVYTTVSGSFR